MTEKKFKQHNFIFECETCHFKSRSDEDFNHTADWDKICPNCGSDDISAADDEMLREEEVETD